MGAATKDFTAPRRGRHILTKETEQQLADIESIRKKFAQALSISNDCPDGKSILKEQIG